MDASRCQTAKQAPTSSPFRFRPFRDTTDTGVAGIDVAILVPGHVGGLDRLTRPPARAIADRAEHPATPVQSQYLAILSARHPRIAVRVEADRADQISHLQGLEKVSILRINDDAILLSIADPDIAVGGIHRDAMGHAEFALPDAVAKPLIDEFAIFVQLQNTGRTDHIRGR